ncbi:uncharacterized protein (DUF1015 family) [Lewinella marina]|uniref:DUF1015 domain-containing protein n=1 Tax=Neolewinella marina TaxID=438751 RepID=A0A2G0CGD4_9BACT|nr:DUF1015 family protein [Neolewinella marina]NJB86507.1 uncharacterized protein (DUF1015 family) [Neolewinella marina]PHK99036.1 hypothetical protein CGL56_06135 [Neolewinella marina]
MMPALHPFPRFYHPAPGIHEALPVTRAGVRQLSPFPFACTEGPCFPSLTIRNGEDGRTAHGVCGLLSADCFSDGTVSPHEKTLTARLNRQQQLVSADRGALGKPVLLTTPSLNGALSGNLPDAQSDPVVFYGDNHIYRLQRGALPGNGPLPLTGPLVIADGHHRAYTHAQLAAGGRADCQFIPVVIVEAGELFIGTFLRLIDGEGRSLPTLLDQLEPFFTISATSCPRPPGHAGEWLLSYRDNHFLLSRRDGASTDTDPGWINAEVLPRVFGITDTRSDPRITSVDPPPVIEGQVHYDAGYEEKIKLLGFPLSRDRFFTEVQAGRTLPPKSTRFEPRVPSGLLVWIPGNAS